MKILISSHRFPPDVGGIESVSLLLAQEFVRSGHVVRLVTQTPARNPCDFGFEVIRRPQPRQLLDLMRWCDLYFQNNISLQALWPLSIVRRPWVVAHHTWLRDASGKITLPARIKLWLLRYASSISVSEAIAKHIDRPSVAIGNPYREDLFRVMPEIDRDRDLVFLGRLVSDKGADLLIDALALLQKEQLRPNATIVGAGPEADPLKAQVQRLGLQHQVEFVGVKTGEELVRCLNRHTIVAIPSRWAEPFGLVALEGIACGCVAVGSAAGGLKDAIGPCGVTFPNGDAVALARQLANLLRQPEALSQYRERAPEHLARHQRDRVAKAYLQVFEEALCQFS
ncbi:glycosyltransferase family 4 protein [Synechococcus sp. PCC 7336]|uniref:glycosyltransferase family 4 protein n=1 Tax=Synechococcus sp. PCC 7336 TaxID=195250 RepID=UPI0003470FEF|nr:glycosyltransferase family 4 protein [Synechococcus sp. PCC 7336]